MVSIYISRSSYKYSVKTYNKYADKNQLGEFMLKCM